MGSACFTGHRNLPQNRSTLSQQLYNALEAGIVFRGLTDFYVGGAIGWDTLAAQTVLNLRNFYPEIKLHLILPCSNRELLANWTTEQISDFQRIFSSADSSEYTSVCANKNCMMKRNARLVECADTLCYCFWNPKRSRSGTAQTVRMAMRKYLEIMNFYETK